MTASSDNPTDAGKPTLSAEQRSEIRGFLESQSEDLFIHRHSQSILNRVSKIVFSALGAIAIAATWIGYNTLQDITESISNSAAQEAAKRVNELIGEQSTEIEDQVREVARIAAEDVAGEAVDIIVAGRVTPTLNNKLSEFEAMIEGISTSRFDLLNEAMLRVFPVLESLQALSHDRGEDFASRFKAMEDSSIEFRMRTESQGRSLSNATNELHQTRENVAALTAQIADQAIEISNIVELSAELEKRLANLTDIREATDSICNLFAVVPKTRIVEALGHPAPVDDAELPFRIESALDRITRSCPQQ